MAYIYKTILRYCPKEKEKFLFFYSQNDTEIKLQQIYKKYPDIHFVRIRSLSL